MYAFRLVLATLLSLTLTVSTSPTAVPRQLGNLACNIARIKILAQLGIAGSAVDKIADPATKTAAQAGLDTAGGGIKAIAKALLSGDPAPATARTDVASGLSATNATLTAADQ